MGRDGNHTRRRIKSLVRSAKDASAGELCCSCERADSCTGSCEDEDGVGESGGGRGDRG